MTPRRRTPLGRIGFILIAALVVLTVLARRTGMVPGGAGAFDPADYRDVPVVTAEEAGDLVGERAVVCGHVVNATFASGTGGQPTFLNLERPFPDQFFDVVIWGRDRGRFDRPPEAFYADIRICVAGRITTHQGVPRIEVSTPEQVRFQRW
jgi:hypothetical protein